MTQSVPAALALVALVALAAACRHDPVYAAVTPRGDADSCTAVRGRVDAGGYMLADLPPVERPGNQQPAELAPEDDAGKPVPGFVLSYLVDAAGAVDPSTIRLEGRTSPPLEASLVRAVRRWRFTPARYHGCAVAHLARDTFTFTAPPK